MNGARLQFGLGRTALFAVLLAYFFSLRLYSAYDLGAEWVDADLGYRASQTTRLLQGQRLYQDFWAPYPPLPYYLNVALFRAFGIRLSAFRIGLAVVGTLTAFLAYVVTRRAASRTAALAACLLCASWSVVSLNINYNTWYCAPLALAAAWTALIGVQTFARWPWAVAGVFAGLTLSFKVTYGLFITTALGLSALSQRGGSDTGLPRFAGTLLLVCAGLGSVMLISLQNVPTLATAVHFGLPLAVCAAWAYRVGQRAQAGRPAWPRLWRIAGGLGLALLPWLVLFAVQWTVPAFLRHIFVSFAELGESVALPPAQPNARAVGTGLLLAGLLGAQWRCTPTRPWLPLALAALTPAACLFVLAVPATGGGDPDMWLLTVLKSWVHVRGFVPVVAIWVALVLLWRRPEPTGDQIPLFTLTASAAASFLTYFPYSDVNHLQWAWPPQAVLVCVVLDRAMRFRARRLAPLWALPFAVAAIQWGALGTHFARPPAPGEPWQWRTFRPASPPRGDVRVPAERAAMVDGAVQYIRSTTAKDAPILELYGALLAFLADRPTATPYDYFWPGFLDEAEQRAVIAALEARPAAYVIGHKRDAADDPMARFREYFPILGAYLAERCRPDRLIGPYQFYKLRPAAAAS